MNVPEIIKGNDIIGKTQRGIRKTAYFSIPILEMLESNNYNTQFIILVIPVKLINLSK